MTLHLTNPLTRGAAVERLQIQLAQRGFLKRAQIDAVFGPATAAAVVRAKRALGYPARRCLPYAGGLLSAYLNETRKPPLAWRARAKARGHKRRRNPTSELRARIVAVCQWGIANERRIHYEQSRPIDGLHQPRKLPLSTDCSGFATDAYAWAGAPDPNGNDYNGLGYTGTLLEHGRRVARQDAKPGDLVVFGEPPGHHVCVVMQAGDDPWLCSHGQERGPMQTRYSAEQQYQPQPAVWISYLD